MVPEQSTLSLGLITLQIQPAADAVELIFSSSGNLIAKANIAFAEPIAVFEIRESRRGPALRVTLPSLQKPLARPRHWMIQFIPVPGESLLQIVELSSIGTGAWTIDFAGSTLHLQKQLDFLTGPTEGQRFRFGGFTQHGQLLDFKDWFFVERDGNCTGLLALRPGSWTHPKTTAARALGAGDLLRVELPHGLPRVRRSFLLAHGPARELLAKHKTGIEYFDSPDGYAAWPARRVARLGFARGERVQSYARASALVPNIRPRQFAFGDTDAMTRAIRRAQDEPDLLANPLWSGEYAAAKAWMFKMLRRFDTALREAGYLHPLGNPVAARALGPAAGLFHMLDFQGELTDAERVEATGLIATLAELLARRDFYPHDFATEPPEFPYTENSVYRGMLNQNFNTDRYVFVGLAGCVLHAHPHAARWRRHAVGQFEAQMRTYVYPGGCWEESHTYANHVKMTVLPMVLALRHVPGDSVDLMTNENFLETCRFFIPLLSPPDAADRNRRHVPAVGDHEFGKHDDYGCIFAWLATLCPSHRDEFLWAWQQEGSPVGEQGSWQTTTFSPLMLPDRNVAAIPTAAVAPSLPAMNLLPGYGAFARRAFGTSDESLLVVRCGPAWGHYHNDQGSFWWWVQNRLIAADAGLGSGPLKFAHRGHNVPGYVGREPRQWLDRHPYSIDQCAESSDGTVTIRCQIPVIYWMAPGEPDSQLPPESRPQVTGTFEWLASTHLRITDVFTRSPDGAVSFSLHVPARSVRRTAPTVIEFDLPPRAVRLSLPTEPTSVQFHEGDGTCGVTCIYAEQTLVHELRLE